LKEPKSTTCPRRRVAKGVGCVLNVHDVGKSWTSGSMPKIKPFETASTVVTVKTSLGVV
jgi:hypothetical protein